MTHAGRSEFGPHHLLWGEVIFDITLNAANFIARKPYGDSRDLYAAIAEWAFEFEATHAATEWGEDLDYLETVDNFACAKLREYFEEED